MPPKKEESSPQNIVLTEEQFSALLSQIRGQPQRDITSPVTTQGCGSFVKCTARFNGDENSDVDAFIDAIQTYKECSNISEDNALRGLSMLFEGLAATWWQGIKATVTNWDSAINTLKDVYSRKLPPHLIYRKVFEQEQSIGEATELFVCNIRALFAQLPYTLSEEAQLDMVYGLLNRKVRKRMPRKDFKTFKEMLNLARSIEQAVQEMNVTHPPSEKKTSGEKPKEMKTKCAYCKAYGHSKEDCRKLNKREDKSTPPGINKTTLVCFGCGTPGYIRAKCPTCSQKKTSEAKVDAISFYSVSAVNTDLKRRPLIPITIAGAQGVAFADSGAQVNLASATLYELLKKTNHVFTESKVNLSFADGRSRGKTVLETKTDVQIQDRIIKTTFIVLPEVQDNNTLLGTQFLKEAKIVLNFGENNWFFSDEGDKSHEFVNEDVLPRNQQLFAVREQNLRVDEGSELTSRETQELNTLLNAHEDIFRLGGAPTTFAIHEINTGDHRPISTPPYPIHGQRKEFLNNELDRLLAEGIIEECESPWASPVVLVPKKNGHYRLCVDYRNLNAITQADTYPMPRIEDLLHSAKSTKYMSTIDLQSGYWQVPIQDSDKDKTCFTTQFGTFRFVRMPFGLRNAPATFMRLMDRFRSGLRDMAIFTYLDDILVLSDTFEKHILDLTSVFDRLRLFNLRARREKCFFVRSSVKYLGHSITPDGIRPDPDKIAAISEMPTPTCVKHVQSFVQTCSWFRKFISGFSEISRPLTNLLKKKSVWKFGKEEEEAFEILKTKLVSAPVLRQADPTKPYMLRTDASSFALGAVLLQGEEHEEKPVEYASRLLTSAEKNYSTVEREALAVIWAATKKFRCYLEGAEVIITTDHQPLQWLFHIKTPVGRLARWAMQLQGMNMKIKYAPGKINVVADTLSRPFGQEHEVNNINFVSVEMPSLTSEDLRSRQLADAELKKIIAALEEDDPIELGRWMERGYCLANGVLYLLDDDREEPRLVIPKEMRPEIMKLYHDAPTAGHYGIERTCRKIASKYYADKSRGAYTFYKSKDLVLLKTHPISSTSKGVAAKLMPRRDGPYEIDKAVSPTTYILSDPHTNRKVGKYHVSDLTPFFGRTEEIPEPTVPKRQRGRPRKLLSSSRGRQSEASGGEV